VPNGVHLIAGKADAMLTGARPEWPSADAAAGERKDDPLRILFIGQAVERKGLPVLLRAFEALREQVPAMLTLVGASSEEIAPLLLDDRGVRALGKVSEERKREELRRAQVLCAPSLHGESFGMVLTEAFAAATPVVASRIPGYRDVVRDGDDGLLVTPGDALALAQALRSLALDERRGARMAANARERAERFAWPRVATNPTPVQTGLGLDFHWNWLNHRPVLWTVVVALMLIGGAYFMLVQRRSPAHLEAPEGEAFAEELPPAVPT